MPLSLPAFRGGLPAAQVDQFLRQALSAYDTARQCTLLWFCEVLSRELYRELGYPSIKQYATESLGFSRNRTWQFLRLARDLQRLPPVKEAVAHGRLEWTKAQQISRVATPRTAQSWVDKAAGSSRRELEQKIKKARSAAKVAAKEAVAGQNVLALGGGEVAAAGADSEAAGLVPEAREAILAGLAALLEDDGRAPGKAAPAVRDLRRRKPAIPYKVVLYRCEVCETTEVVTTAGRRKVDPASAAAALENAVVHKNDNLVTLCSRCHRFVHAQPEKMARWRSKLSNDPPVVP